jgi:hypothetical protein
LPNFWGDVTQGRWDEATQTLRNFGDRYPARRNEEANLLEQAIARGDLASYLVQPGETLSGIASRRGVPAEYLAARNGVNRPHLHLWWPTTLLLLRAARSREPRPPRSRGICTDFATFVVRDSA